VVAVVAVVIKETLKELVLAVADCYKDLLLLNLVYPILLLLAVAELAAQVLVVVLLQQIQELLELIAVLLVLVFLLY
jgi:hypothetical protein